MGRLISFMMISLDGYMAAVNDAIDWQVIDDEFNQFAADQLNAVATLVFGRVTYEGMASYWTTPEAMADDPIIAAKMNELPKIVFSSTLASADWQPTTLIKDRIPEAVAELKQQSGQDLIILGSSNLTASLINLGLVDELRVMVSPVLLGAGKSLFEGVNPPLKLKLIETRNFKAGNVLHIYQPDRS